MFPSVVAGLTLETTVWETGGFAVGRALREDGTRVLIAGYEGRVDGDEEAQLETDAGIIRAGSGSGFDVRTVRDHGRVFLVLEDRQTHPLEELVAKPSPPLDALELGVGLARFLREAHARGRVVDSWPAGLFVQRATGSVLCFPSCAPPAPAARRPLQYTPPEQLVTSRAAPDVAGDLYCLGVTLYRALVGSYPFELEGESLLRAHLVDNPAPPSAIRPAIPSCLSSVVAKLLAKSPEARHRSAASVLEDLLRCRRRLERGAAEQPFEPGVLDVHARIESLPILGRNEELDRFVGIWNRVRQGAVHAVFLQGTAGIGKSSLISALRERTDEQTFFVEGKFDQVNRGLASGALIIALRSLLQRVLAQDDRDFEATRARLRATLGRSAGVLVPFLPELSHLVDDRFAPAMAPEETRHQLEHVLVELVVTIAASRPVALFVDDLQWCGDVAARLIGVLLSRARDCSLLVIGTHRPIEDDRHPVRTLLAELGERRRDVFTELELGPLDADAVRAMVEAVLRAPVENAAILAETLLRKSGGNPFYLRNLLGHVYDRGLVAFDGTRWIVDTAGLDALDVTDNVVDFIVERFDRLSEEDRRLCQVAACQGHVFDVTTLSALTREGPKAILGRLTRLREAHLVMPTRSGGEPGSNKYRFQHDRVHQVAYASMTDTERQEAHLRVGELLLSDRDADEADRDIFLIVDHLNRGASDALVWRHNQLRHLNLRAAERALQGTAYESAVSYADQAARGLDDGVWSQDRDFALALTRARATALYLTGASEQADDCLKSALRHEHRLTERSELYVLSLTVLMVAGRYSEALDRAREALAELSLTLPQEEGAAPSALDPAQVVGLVDAPATEDERAMAGARILGAMLPLTFLGDPSLFPAVVIRSVRLALDEGPTAESAIAVGAYGILLTTTGDYRSAFECGRSAIALGRRFDDLSQRCRAQEIFIACLGHWVAPLRESEPVADDAYRAGIDSGDLQYAAYTRLYDVVNRFFAGHPLAGLRKFCDVHAELPPRIGDRLTGCVIASTRRVVESILEGQGELLHEDEAFVASCREAGGELATCLYFVMKAETLYRRGELAEGLRALEEAEPLLAAAPGVIVHAIVVWIRALTCLRLAGHTEGAERVRLLERADSDAVRLRTWAEQSPSNFLHKLRLVEAERLVLGGDALGALGAFDEAIRLGHDAEYVQDEFLALERCARLCAELGWSAQSQALGARATHAREAWLGRPGDEPVPSTSAAVAEGFQTASPATLLGFTAAVQAAQEVTASLELDEVLRRFVATAMTHCGAERANLILREKGEAYVAQHQSASATEPQPRVDEVVPLQVLHFVERTARPAALRAGRAAPLFDLDPYLKEHRPRALVATPVLHGGVVLGVLFLENRSSDRVFSGGTELFLETLASRAAIALQNARLFESVAREVEQRRAAEERLKATLEEKSLLLREVHHRVGNNLQVVSSLLGLQMDRAEDAKARQALAASRERIRSMALVHHQLYSGDLVTKVEATRYLRDLAAQVVRAHGSRVRLDFALCESLELGVAQAVPLGLVLNELLSNALRHAFPNREEGTVRIVLQEKGADGAELLVGDDGIGLQTPDPGHTHLGLRICEALAKQLEGRLESEGGEGTTFRLEFRVEAPAR